MLDQDPPTSYRRRTGGRTLLWRQVMRYVCDTLRRAVRRADLSGTVFGHGSSFPDGPGLMSGTGIQAEFVVQEQSEGSVHRYPLCGSSMRPSTLPVSTQPHCHRCLAICSLGIALTTAPSIALSAEPRSFTPENHRRGSHQYVPRPLWHAECELYCIADGLMESDIRFRR